MENKMFTDLGLIPFPGMVLKAELQARGITQKAFAKSIGIQASHLSEMMKGKRGISEQTASRLEEELGIPAAHWLKMQTDYQYKVESAKLRNSRESDAADTLQEYDRIYDVRTIFKYAGIQAASCLERLDFCRSQLHFAAPAEQMRNVKGYFHRSENTGLDTRMIATWTVLAEYEAARMPRPAGSFSKDAMDSLAGELAIIFNDNHNTENRVAHTLSEYGIRYCVVPKVPRASIDGFSCVQNGVPAIVVTKRFDRIDNLAFAVMHEVAHLKLHSSEGCKVNLAYRDEEYPEREEREANDYAAEALIPVSIWKYQPQVRPNVRDIQSRYTKWAKDMGLNKWIVLGRVSHETGIYTFKSDDTRKIN